MSVELNYDTLERIRVGQPVDRVDFIAGRCRGRTVLDVGCYDETALIKRGTGDWLHGRICATARRVVGVDNSAAIPPEGIATAPNGRILRGDGVRPGPAVLAAAEFDIVVAGEFIEHLENPLEFLRNLRAALPGRELLLSTPNGASHANGLLGNFGREAQHPDHLQVFTYKTLATLCRRAGLPEWDLVPYRFFATEMILRSTGMKRLAARVVERGIRLVERIAPLRSFGYIIVARL